MKPRPTQVVSFFYAVPEMNITEEQKQGWCASRAVLEMFPASHMRRIWTFLKDKQVHKYSSLSTISNILCNMPQRDFDLIRLHNAAGEKNALVPVVCDLQTGRIVCCYNFHCIYINLDMHQVFDPFDGTFCTFPFEPQARKDTLVTLGFSKISVAYELRMHVNPPMIKKQRKRRNRMRC